VHLYRTNSEESAHGKVHRWLEKPPDVSYAPASKPTSLAGGELTSPTLATAGREQGNLSARESRPNGVGQSGGVGLHTEGGRRQPGGGVTAGLDAAPCEGRIEQENLSAKPLVGPLSVYTLYYVMECAAEPWKVP